MTGAVFYAGINGGYGVARNRSTATAWFYDDAVETVSNGPRGVLGGGQIGYNWQWQKLVLGAETDFQFADQEDTMCLQRCLIGIPGVTNQALKIQQKMPWFGTVRGRLGWVEGATLFYATGGLAYGHIDTNATYDDGTNVVNRSSSYNKTGWTVGAGFETALSGGWSVKAEYLYVDLGSINDRFQWGGPTVRDFVTSDLHNNIFRVGLNYRPFDKGHNGVVATQSVSWNGYHAGLNIGYATARNPSTYNAVGFQPQAEPFNLDPSGAIGGVQFGFDRQFGRWVAGVETDIQAAGQRSSGNCLISCTASTNASVDQQLTWFGTTRGRLGWTTGPALLYATGGVAYGQINTQERYRGIGLFAVPMAADPEASGVKVGWTLGGGIETKLSGRWSAKIEYLYIDFGSQTFSFVNDFGAGNTNVTTVSTHIHDHVGRLGLNYSFN